MCQILVMNFLGLQYMCCASPYSYPIAYIPPRVYWPPTISILFWSRFSSRYIWRIATLWLHSETRNVYFCSVVQLLFLTPLQSSHDYVGGNHSNATFMFTHPSLKTEFKLYVRDLTLYTFLHCWRSALNTPSTRIVTCLQHFTTVLHALYNYYILL